MAWRSWTCIRLLDGLHAQLVGRAVDEAPFDAAAGQPHREPQAVVIATLGPFGIRRPAEFTAPDHQRVFQQAAGFQVLEQCGDRPIALAGMVAVFVDVLMVVPRLAVSVVDLNHAHAALDQAASDQAGIRKLAVAVFAGE